MTRIRPRDADGTAFHFGFDITVQGEEMYSGLETEYIEMSGS